MVKRLTSIAILALLCVAADVPFTFHDPGFLGKVATPASAPATFNDVPASISGIYASYEVWRLGTKNNGDLVNKLTNSIAATGAFADLEQPGADGLKPYWTNNASVLRPWLQFDQTDDFLRNCQIEIVQPAHVFFVGGVTNDSSANNHFAVAATNGVISPLFMSSGNLRVIFGSSVAAGAVPQGTTPYLFEVLADTTSSTVFTNGVQRGGTLNVGTSPWSGMVLGARGNLTQFGGISFWGMYIYTNAGGVTGADLTKLRTYVQTNFFSTTGADWNIYAE